MNTKANQGSNADGLRIETDPKVKQSHCPCCGRLMHTHTGFVYKENNAYAIYSASLHPNESNRKMGLTIAIGGDWEDETTFKDHISLDLLIQPSSTEIQMSILDGKANEKASKLWGKRLTRKEILTSPLKDDFFQIADVIVKKDKRINDYLESY